MALSREERYLKDIMLIFQISEADLDVNRRGEISETQQKRMDKVQFQGALFSASIFWVMAAVFYGILFFSWSDINRHLTRGDTMLQITLIGFFVVLPTVCVLVGLGMMFFWWRNKDDVELSEIEGNIRLKYRRIRRSEFYDLFIGSEKFPITPDIYGTLKDGLPHRVYYVDATKHIVAVEPLTD